MSTPPPPPGYGTLPPDPDDPSRPDRPIYGQHVPPGQPAPYGQQPPYGHQPPYRQASPYGQQPPANSNLKTMGIVSLVVGIIALPSACCCWFLGWIPALAALGTGIYGLTQAKDDPTAGETKPFFIAGVALGAIALLLTAASAIFGAASFVTDYTTY